MGKVFYTERDIEEMAQTGIKEIKISEGVVLTDLAYAAAKKLEIQIINVQDETNDGTGWKDQQANINSTIGAIVQINDGQIEDLKKRIELDLKNKISDPVESAQLDRAIEKVLGYTPYLK